MQLFDFSINDWFFDRAHVIERVGKARVDSLMRAAGRIWKTAQRRIRPRKKSSKPGQSPTSHTGHLRYGLRFAYDPTTDGAVIGPVKYNIVYFDNNRKPVTGTVPQVLEEGGDITILEEHVRPGPGGWRRVDLRRRSRPGVVQRFRTAHIEPRPYMAPSLDANLKHIPEEFRDSVRA